MVKNIACFHSKNNRAYYCDTQNKTKNYFVILKIIKYFDKFKKYICWYCIIVL